MGRGPLPTAERPSTSPMPSSLGLKEWGTVGPCVTDRERGMSIPSVYVRSDVIVHDLTPVVRLADAGAGAVQQGLHEGAGAGGLKHHEG